MLGDSVEKRKNIVWRDYDRSMFSIWSNSENATCAWWESIALSHLKLHQNSNNLQEQISRQCKAINEITKHDKIYLVSSQISSRRLSGMSPPIPKKRNLDVYLKNSPLNFYKVRRYNIIQIPLFDDDLSWPSTLIFTKVNSSQILINNPCCEYQIPPKFQSPMWSWYILLSTACHKTFNSQYQTKILSDRFEMNYLQFINYLILIT
jgi:hypothetical protein